MMNQQSPDITPKRQSFANFGLLPLEEKTRGLATGLYELVRDLPIISPHGHVDPSMLLGNQPFRDPADLFIYHNHYVTRLLHADGVPMEAIRKPSLDGNSVGHAKVAWKEFLGRMHLFAGTPSGYWFRNELERVFGITEEPSAASAERLFEEIACLLAEPALLPQALFKEFNIEVLATTDSPTDDLAPHKALAESDLSGRVIPTFRPDSFINPNTSGWKSRVEQIVQQTGENLSHQGFVTALEKRRQYFKEHGAVSVDIGAESAFTTILEEATASKLFNLAIAGKISDSEAVLYRGHMIGEMIRMSCEDGLVITLHVGVHRNHSSNTLAKFGPDAGADIPIQAEFVENLHPVLEKYGLHPNLHLILFALDETTWSREIAPLAGFYPSVFVGAPWWFLDAPLAARRFRDATVETAGFYRGSGFIDDTRAFLSIPARHDMARRVDSGFLAELVAKEQINLETAEKIAVDLVTTIPKRAFKL